MATDPYNTEGREPLRALPGRGTRLRFNKPDQSRNEDQPSNKPMIANASPFDSVKVFCATKHNDRERLGELITDWIRAHPGIEIIDKVVTQSSDSEFHCITITIFYRSAP